LDSEERYIIEGLRSGRENAYRKLFDQYYRRLVVFANKYLGDMESARDIVQDLFVDLYDSR
jgi:RNA polymerase sigma-70 factor (ECF subfamily)